MPPKTLFDLSSIEMDRVLYDRAEIEAVNPHRGAMMHLDAISYVDGPDIAGYKDVRSDEFWVPGHIPGRPVLPGVIQLEAAAQLAGFYTGKIVGWDGFIGLGTIDKAKFRLQIVPGQRLYLLCRKTEQRHRRVKCATQGVVDGQIAFEAEIVGTQLG